MTVRQWLAFGAGVLGVVALTSWHRVRPNVGEPVPVPLARLDRFAQCLPLTRSERTVIVSTRHYLVDTPVRDTLGKAVQGHYVWVYAPDTVSGLFEHEWMHLILPDGDPWHQHRRWLDAHRCGAI